LMGIAPTGNRMELTVCFVLEIRDGKIFIYKLEQVVRIRTGETGSNAL